MSSVRTPIRIFKEIADLIASEPGRDAILEFRPSAAAQRRATELLEKDRRESLTVDEREELDEFLQAEDFMRLLKAGLRSRNGAA
jgi:hypothetical protein